MFRSFAVLTLMILSTLVTANGLYHLPGAAGGKFVPFVTAGYTAANLQENQFNLGGGVDNWFKRNIGLRVEFRDHIVPGHTGGLNFAGFRGGIVWR
jgi:hypothetical protein